jgi:hypothetical protein
MDINRVLTEMAAVFGINEEDARVLCFIPCDMAWNAQSVADAINKRIKMRNWHPPFLARMQALAANLPSNLSDIGFYLEGLQAAGAGELLADAPDHVVCNLLSAIDPSVLS